MSDVRYMFLSFRDAKANKNLGACIVEAPGFKEAILKVWRLGLNPGGEVLSFGLTEEDFEHEDLELNRLYGPEEMQKFGYEKI